MDGLDVLRSSGPPAMGNGHPVWPGGLPVQCSSRLPELGHN